MPGYVFRRAIAGVAMLLLLFTVPACSTTTEREPTMPEKPAVLEDTTWSCTAYDDGTGELVDVLEGSQITVVFGTDGSISGDAGVNTYNGPCTVSGEEMTIMDAIYTTRMAGPEPLMEQERTYLRALPKVTRYTIEGDRLTLYGGDGEGSPIAEYTRIAP